MLFFTGQAKNLLFAKIYALGQNWIKITQMGVVFQNNGESKFPEKYSTYQSEILFRGRVTIFEYSHVIISQRR